MSATGPCPRRRRRRRTGHESTWDDDNWEGARRSIAMAESGSWPRALGKPSTAQTLWHGACGSKRGGEGERESRWKERAGGSDRRQQQRKARPAIRQDQFTPLDQTWEVQRTSVWKWQRRVVAGRQAPSSDSGERARARVSEDTRRAGWESERERVLPVGRSVCVPVEQAEGYGYEDGAWCMCGADGRWVCSAPIPAIHEKDVASLGLSACDWRPARPSPNDIAASVRARGSRPARDDAAALYSRRLDEQVVGGRLKSPFEKALTDLEHSYASRPTAQLSRTRCGGHAQQKATIVYCQFRFGSTGHSKESSPATPSLLHPARKPPATLACTACTPDAHHCDLGRRL